MHLSRIIWLLSVDRNVVNKEPNFPRYTVDERSIVFDSGCLLSVRKVMQIRRFKIDFDYLSATTSGRCQLCQILWRIYISVEQCMYDIYIVRFQSLGHRSYILCNLEIRYIKKSKCLAKCLKMQDILWSWTEF
jgi:hypothetical protein